MSSTATILARGAIGSRPAAGSPGHVYLSTEPKTYRDNGSSWDDVSDAGTAVTDATIATSDVTTNNVSTSKHGWAPKAPNDATKYLDGTGAYSVPAGGGGGSDLVQTSSGAGSVYIPGLRGSPDVKPASPNAKDDEFEALSGWTTLGALDTSNVSDVPSHWHAKKTTGGQSVDGIYKAIPSMPFTVTAKITDRAFDTDYQSSGLMLLEASPGKLVTFGARHHVSFHGLAWERVLWTNRTTDASDLDTDVGLTGASTTALTLQNNALVYPYLRFVVASSTDVTMQVSARGLYWITVYTAVNPGFTIGSVGLFLYSYAAVSNEAWFDWIRFT